MLVEFDGKGQQEVDFFMDEVLLSITDWYFDQKLS